MLCACADIAPSGRFQLTAPSALSTRLASMDMRVKLALASPVTASCAGPECEADAAFERRVATLGARLAEAAYVINPALKERVRAFSFSVARTSDPGSVSDAAGAVVIFRGVRTPHLDEGALAFLIAREMGHVIARHHDEEAAARIIATIASQFVLPMASLTSLTDLAAGSAVSTAGAQFITAAADSERLHEANAIALGLLAREGWRPSEVAKSLAAYAADLGNDSWSQEIKAAVEEIKKITHTALLGREPRPPLAFLGGRT